MKSFKEPSLEMATRAVKRALANGFDEAIAVVRVSRSTMVKLANSQVSISQGWEGFQVEVYLAKGKRVAIAGARLGSPSEVERIVDEYRRYIESIGESRLYAPLPKPSGRPLAGLVDSATLRYIEEAPRLAEEMMSGAVEYGAERVAGMVSAGLYGRAVVGSNGAELYEEKTRVEAYLRAFRGEFSGHWAYGSRRADPKRLREVGAKAATYASMCRTSVSVEPGRYRAVLSPLVVGNLMEYVADAASAFSVLAGFSMFMKRRPGEKVASDALTLIDDPHHEELPGSTGFDDEGVATLRKAIIERGVFKSLLHNSKTAALMGGSSTGNAGLITPHPWNLVVQPGSLREEEIFGELRRGLFVLNNWYTRLHNYIEGEFSTVTRDALMYVENGEVVGCVHRMRIADRFPRLLSRIAGLTREVYDVEWWEVRTPTRTPFILVDEAVFTKPTV